MLKKASKVDTPEDDWKEYTDPFTSKGNIKFGEYGKIVKKNLKDMKDESGLAGEMFDMLTDPMYIKGFAMNPVAGVINLVSHKLIPGIFRESLGALDKSLNSVLPAVLAKINTFEDSDSALLQKINQIFGHKQKVDYDIKLGEYEKGQIAWDGESKKALVDVIPS